MVIAMTIDGATQNVGIGTTSPDMRLHCFSANSAVAKLEGTGGAYCDLTDGTVTLRPQIAGTEAYLRTTGAHKLNLGTNNSVDVTIDVAGNVGIGTASPDGTCHILTATAGSVTPSANADDLVVENSGHAGITILSPDAFQSAVYFGSPSDSIGSAIAYSHDTGIFTVGTHRAGGQLVLNSAAGLEAMRIDSDGNVGIGTAAPSDPLTVVGLTTIGSVANHGVTIKGAVNGSTHYNWQIACQQNLNAAFEITPSTAGGGSTFSTPTVCFLQSGGMCFGTDSNTIFYSPAADTLAWKTAGTERMRINSSGNVGIGTTTPTVELDVSGSINANGVTLDGGSTLVTNGTFSSDLTGWQTNTSGSATIVWNAGSMRMTDAVSAGCQAATASPITLVVGKAYRLSVDLSGSYPGIYFKWGLGTTAWGLETVDSGYTYNGNGSYSVDFVATAASNYITFIHAGDSQYVDVDNVVLVEIPLFATGGAYVSGDVNIGSATSVKGSSLNGRILTLGTGTDSGNGLLQLYGYSGSTDGVLGGIYSQNGNAGDGKGCSSITLLRSDSGNDSGVIAFDTRENTAGSLTERMRIGRTGNVGIGTVPVKEFDLTGTVPHGRIADLRNSVSLLCGGLHWTQSGICR